MAAPDLPTAAMRGGWVPVGRRVHRLVTAPAGAIVVSCMFLPFISDCDHTTLRAVDEPARWPWFLIAGVIALGALVARRAWARGFALAVELGWYATALVWIAATGGLGAWLGALAIAAMVTVRASVRDPEARLASEAVLVAVASGILFTCTAILSETLVGGALAVVAEGWLLVGAVAWSIEQRGELGARGRAIVIAVAVVAIASYGFVLADVPWHPEPGPRASSLGPRPDQIVAARRSSRTPRPSLRRISARRVTPSW